MANEDTFPKNKETLIHDSHDLVVVYNRDGRRAFFNLPIAAAAYSLADSSGEIVCGRTYKLNAEKVKFVPTEDIGGNEFYLIEISGLGEIEVVIADKDGNLKANATLSLDSLVMRSYLIVSTEEFPLMAGDSLRCECSASSASPPPLTGTPLCSQ